MRTSAVPIIFSANLRISLMARGARFLKPLQNNDICLVVHNTFMFDVLSHGREKWGAAGAAAPQNND